MFIIPTKSSERFVGLLSVSLKYNLEHYIPVVMLSLMLSTHKPSTRQIGAFFLRFCRDKANVDRFFNNEQFDSLALLTSGINLVLQQEDVRTSWHWVVIIDTTVKRTCRKPKRSKKSKKRKRTNTVKYKDKGKHGTGSQTHLWVLGLLLTDKGVRIPLPRKSYWTKRACKKYNLVYHSQVDIAVQILKDVNPADNVTVTVLYDSFFEGSKLDRYCQERHFTYITPVDSARKVALEDGTPTQKSVVQLGQELPGTELTNLSLTAETEQYALFRRSLRRKGKKTQRCYAIHKRMIHISKLGLRTVVFSKKEQTKKNRKTFTFKALLTNNPTLTALQIVELYELRWEIELFFKELKQFLHFTAYSFDDFGACERWVDLVLLSFVFLEYERLQILSSDAPLKKKQCVRHARTLQMIEIVKQKMLQENMQYLEETLRNSLCRTALLHSLKRVHRIL